MGRAAPDERVAGPLGRAGGVMSGKGDGPRPRGCTDEEWDEKWKRIFRRVRDDRLREAPAWRAIQEADDGA